MQRESLTGTDEGAPQGPPPWRARGRRRPGLATKRILDIVVAASALFLASPFLLAIAAWIRLTMGSPVLFRQRRPGYRGEPFTIIKFRSMRDAIGPDGRELPDTERLTRFGDLLRRTALDELPELWNVLRGEMSLVGPRPLLMEYLDLYTPEQARRHDMRPGITGWAQVHGRRSLDMPERLRLDVWYVDHWSLRLDLHILWLTGRTIASGSGAATHDVDADAADPFEQVARQALARQGRPRHEIER